MTTTESFATPAADRSHKKAPRYVSVAAWAAPIMMLTGWAFLAAIPVAAVTAATWADTRVRALRWWATLSAIAYAIPLTTYLGQDTYPSMSKMLAPMPMVTAFIVVPAIVVVAKLWRSHRG